MRAPTKQSAYGVLAERGVPVATVLDVGIHHCTAELIHFYPDKKHVLFEPVVEFEPKIREFYRNLDYELHQVAVSDKTGRATLQKFAKTQSGLVTHSTLGKDGDDAVEMVTLDGFLAGRTYGLPYLLKVDVDGLELSVLAGAADTLKDCSVVVVECAGNSIVRRAQAVIDAGFKLFDLAEPCYYDGTFWQCDAIFVRRDIHAALFKPLSGSVDASLYEAFKDR